MSHPFFSIGFRPFYLGAGCFAALAIPLWTASLLGAPAIMSNAMGPFAWHAHEMVFGFAPAVMLGFLLTAVRNWTGRQTPSGGGLAALFCWWLAVRALNFFNGGPFGLIVEGGFFIAAALVLAVPLWQARNHRNAFVVPLLLGLGAAAVSHQAALQGWLPAVSPAKATTLALDLVLLLITIIAGRVIPAFSSNAVTGLAPRSWPLLDGVAIASVVGILLTDLLTDRTVPWTQPLLLGAAIVHAVRLLGWQPWKTWRNPLLLALPLAYAWIPVHLLLRVQLPGVALHALTIGAMAGLMLAMMTRSALGHTGRPLKAGAAEIVCFVAINLAAVCRVFGPGWLPYELWIWAATLLWILAFGTFSVVYWPRLMRPRIDG